MDQSDGKDLTDAPSCHRCKKIIYDGTIFKVAERYWHNSCLQCVVCRKSLNAYCHVKGTDVYCRTDFTRLFGTNCVGCQKTISPHENVRVAGDNVYHLACFTCVACTCVIQTGSYVYTRDDGRLICSGDYKKLLQHGGFPSGSDADESGPDDADEGIQTTINENQLRMLQHVFQSNKRPVRHVREELSRETGLSMRVIQIWFRNERIKERSNVAPTANHETSRLPVPLIPSVAQSSRQQQTNALHNGNFWPTPFPMVQTNNDSTRNCYDVPLTSSHQFYCPLDYLIPDEMPPNVDLSAADICNGEVIPGKYQYDNRKFPMFNEQSRETLIPNTNRPWISV